MICSKHSQQSEPPQAETKLDTIDDALKFLEKESGHFVGSWRPRHVTFWVEYAISDEGCVIYDAWCHRMWLPGAMQPGKEI